jgi:hypothetical protein
MSKLERLAEQLSNLSPRETAEIAVRLQAKCDAATESKEIKAKAYAVYLRLVHSRDAAS